MLIFRKLEQLVEIKIELKALKKKKKKEILLSRFLLRPLPPSTTDSSLYLLYPLSE